MRVRVLLFASYRESAGFAARELDLPDGATVAEAWERIAPEVPAARGARPLAAVGEQHAPSTRALREGEVVAFFPPVSGGAGEAPGGSEIGGEARDSGARSVRLLPRPIGPSDVEALVAAVSSPTRGGVTVFLGAVRKDGPAANREVVSIEYEAYGGMADSEMARIEEEAASRSADTALRCLHSSGVVRVGEVSVAVAAAAPHRAQAFEACRFAIDRLKETVPIWKKERYAGGESEWVRGG